jgi:hypothetical protein
LGVPFSKFLEKWLALGDRLSEALQGTAVVEVDSPGGVQQDWPSTGSLEGEQRQYQAECFVASTKHFPRDLQFPGPAFLTAHHLNQSVQYRSMSLALTVIE